MRCEIAVEQSNLSTMLKILLVAGFVMPAGHSQAQFTAGNAV